MKAAYLGDALCRAFDELRMRIYLTTSTRQMNRTILPSLTQFEYDSALTLSMTIYRWLWYQSRIREYRPDAFAFRLTMHNRSPRTS